MKRIIQKHKLHWSQKAFTISAVLSIVLLLTSLLVNYFANVYVQNSANGYVADIILDNIPVINVGYVFYEGFALLWVGVIFLLLWEPKNIPFVVKSIALFIVIRSLFITLTHLGLPPIHSYMSPDSSFRYISSGNDMFFSSHTGLPFLMALIFWKNKKLKIIFISASVLFAICVLLGHLHYSIDVFAAFFITYSIFEMAKKFFAKDYRLFDSMLEHNVN